MGPKNVGVSTRSRKKPLQKCTPTRAAVLSLTDSKSVRFWERKVKWKTITAEKKHYTCNASFVKYCKFPPEETKFRRSSEDSWTLSDGRLTSTALMLSSDIKNKRGKKTAITVTAGRLARGGYQHPRRISGSAYL